MVVRLPVWTVQLTCGFRSVHQRWDGCCADLDATRLAGRHHDLALVESTRRMKPRYCTPWQSSVGFRNYTAPTPAATKSSLRSSGNTNFPKESVQSAKTCFQRI